MKLSPNFTLEEACESQRAERMGISNSPDADTLDRMIAVAENILEPVRAHFGKPVIINSFFRSAALEKAICWGGNDVDSPFAKWCKKRGKPVSEASWPDYFKLKSHPEGEAADFKIPGIDNAAVARWVRDNLTFDQCILEFYKPGIPDSGWVHVSYKAEGCRQECLTVSASGTVRGLPDIGHPFS